eukprot:CAMPEP_0181293634 /NCGR_PEP_ID=MMETSP1101-20121128/3168_1 /TAXON_ID=46948 /ORGANISM="Rhodomonas abbreviata, Strain Caron Lab Isolate" /LENGTH=215 /DNA_ID=CAMNT_0023398231 /DNA_START=180 /DNA_END=825 /DNA_ORIENTATION=+
MKEDNAQEAAENTTIGGEATASRVKQAIMNITGEFKAVASTESLKTAKSQPEQQSASGSAQADDATSKTDKTPVRPRVVAHVAAHRPAGATNLVQPTSNSSMASSPGAGASASASASGGVEPGSKQQLQRGEGKGSEALGLKQGSSQGHLLEGNVAGASSDSLRAGVRAAESARDRGVDRGGRQALGSHVLRQPPAPQMVMAPPPQRPTPPLPPS